MQLRVVPVFRILMLAIAAVIAAWLIAQSLAFGLKVYLGASSTEHTMPLAALLLIAVDLVLYLTLPRENR